ncbi:hypothetical protein NC797_17520 [Aquibacillus sp. 3ASR75-11]|uniref:Uncharacterized protein n=1 Tax=Terrihalobacillus insolitus TaxID=2950438 RepID=A0A9X3WZM7_9BACI|nr:hypothetical protein [Terrihalobacillus insolitus]MDC3413698.1 hypothetical protein [Terrihalobacillus insolitus]MDC3426284.1 hypothetical protein [Terrihalobacillus insolitus]
MTYLVTNCFDWVGFHIVNRLLHDGNEVIGIDKMDTEKKENLALFIGRNSAFRHEEEIGNNVNDEMTAIYHISDQIERSKELASISARNNINIKFSKKSKPFHNDWTTIVCPILCGEWMERDDEGFYWGDEYIRFDSRRFDDEVIYIDDFISWLFQLENSNIKAREIRLHSNQMTGNGTDRASDLYLCQRKSPDRCKRLLHEHYRNFRNLYNVTNM